MKKTIEGTIHGKHIDLDDETSIPEGSRVKLRIEPLETQSDGEKLQRLLALFKEMGRDKSLLKVLEKIVKERSAPREVDLDAAP